jgi:hypothetical protein
VGPKFSVKASGVSGDERGQCGGARYSQPFSGKAGKDA